MGGRKINRLFAIKNIVSTFLVFMMFFISINACLIRTPAGQHCPTAPVQIIAEVVPVGSDGEICLTESVSRIPNVGDSEFKQCLCAEKKAAEAQSTGGASEKVTILVLMAPEPADIASQALETDIVLVMIPQDVTEKTDVHGCPSTPPPNGLV